MKRLLDEAVKKRVGALPKKAAKETGNQDLKQLLQEAFAVPAPQNKEIFLKKVEAKGIHKPDISYGGFLLIQAAYIRKRVWAVSILVFGAALLLEHLLEREVLWVLSAMMPFLAVSAVAENLRSESFGMAELEMASRFSFKSVVLARMWILGFVHLTVLCLAALLCSKNCGSTLLQTGVYLLVPYLLTDGVSLWLIRKIRGKEAVYASVGVAVIIGVLPDMGRYATELLYDGEMFFWWLIALVLLMGITFSEGKKNLARTEELTWNLR